MLTLKTTRESHTVESASGGGTLPMVRNDATGSLEACDWGTALETFCRRFRSTGGKAAWMASGGLTNEELGFMAALGKTGLQFDSGGAEPLLERPSLGSCEAWQVPGECDVVVAIGERASEATSPLWQGLSWNRHQPRIHLVDGGTSAEQEWELAHYRPRPGSSTELFLGLGNILIASGWVNWPQIVDRTVGFAEYASAVAPISTDRVSEITGLNGEKVWQLAEAVGTATRVGFWRGESTAGRGDSDLMKAISNLALLRGDLGQPGTGVCVGSPSANANGARLFAGSATDMGTLAELEEAAGSRELTALWLVVTDGFFDQEIARRVQKLAAQMEFVAVQAGPGADAWLQDADVYLPSAGWRGKEGTMLDPGGQLRLLKKRDRTAGASLTDFRIFQLIAQYWGCGAQFSRWSGPEAAFQILREEKKWLEESDSGAGGVMDYSALDGRRILHAAARISEANAERASFLKVSYT